MHRRPTASVISLMTLLAGALTSLSCDQPIPPNVKLAPVADEVGSPWDKKTLYGYADANLRFWIYPRFDEADMFVGDRARVRENGMWGIINREGEYVVPPRYELLHVYKDRTVSFCENGAWGIMDLDGNVVLPARYASPVVFYKDGLAPACVIEFGLRKCGYIDRSGEFVIPAKFSRTTQFLGEYAVVSVGNGMSRRDGLIDRKGNWAVPPQYQSIGNHRSGYVSVATSGGWGIITLDSDWVHPPNYDWAHVEGDNKFLLRKNEVQLEVDDNPVPDGAFDAVEPSAGFRPVP